MKISIIFYTYKKSIKTNLFEEYVNFVDNPKKQNKNCKISIILIAIIMFLFLFFLLFQYLNLITVSHYNKYLEQVSLILF